MNNTQKLRKCLFIIVLENFYLISKEVSHIIEKCMSSIIYLCCFTFISLENTYILPHSQQLLNIYQHRGGHNLVSHSKRSFHLQLEPELQEQRKEAERAVRRQGRWFGKDGNCTEVVEVGSYGGTREACWRLKKGNLVICSSMEEMDFKERPC